VREPVDRGDPADVISDLDVRRALATLDPTDRLIVALRYVAGLDSGEIARQTGMSASGVRSRLSRLLSRLRSEIDHV
jgi:RNA polymerase sigma factor (sigma-70 family)